jgi:hypothetical protein
MEVLSSVEEPGNRYVRLRVTSPRGARILTFSVPDAEVAAATVNGVDVGDPRRSRLNTSGSWILQFSGTPDAGIVLWLHLRGVHPVTLVIQDRSFGLPVVPGRLLARRSNSMMGTDVTVVRRTFVL